MHKVLEELRTKILEDEHRCRKYGMKSKVTGYPRVLKMIEELNKEINSYHDVEEFYEKDM